MSSIDEVKQRTDIVEIVGQYAQLVKAGRNFRALCPFHSEKTPSFFVFPERQSWHCFGACGTGGDAFSFIMKRENVDFPEALRRLADHAGVILPSYREVDARKETRERLYQANEAARRYFHDILVSSAAGEKVRLYLEGRGLAAKTISDFGLGYAMDTWDGLKRHLAGQGYSEGELTDAGLLSSNENGRTYDRWRDRLIIPIKDEKGRTTGFGARTLGSAEGPKYINSPQTSIFDKSATLYGLDMAGPAIRQQDLAVIVEGYMDVMAAHQYGFSNVVASMGTSITEKQIATLKKLSRNLALALDSDAAGEEAMLRCVGYENTLETEIRVIALPEGKDPDDVIKADANAWQRLISDAKPVIDYAFDRVSGNLDLTKSKDRSAALDRLMPFVAGIENLPRFVWRRHKYLQRLARMARVPEKDLEAVIDNARAATRRTRARGGEPTEAASTARALIASPREEYCLALLLRHPELKARGLEMPLEYFENSENREILLAWRDNCDCTVEIIKEKIDIDIREHFEQVTSKSIPLARIEQKFDQSVLMLREEHLRNLEKKREVLLALEAESGGTAAELAKLKEQGAGVSAELKQVFGLKGRR